MADTDFVNEGQMAALVSAVANKVKNPALPYDVFQESDGTWPDSGAYSNQRTNWIGYPGLTNQPASTGRPAAVAGLDSYVAREA